MTEDSVEWIVSQYFPPCLQRQLALQRGVFAEVQEIRCRIGRPVFLRLRCGEERMVQPSLSTAELQHLVSRISQGSAYAWEEEFRRGYLTLPGGHRVGLTGKGVLEGGRIRTIKAINGLNFRIARQVLGAADEMLPFVLADGIVHNTLLVSPPGCGKTTLLRDLIRQLSDGVPALQFTGVNVAVVDERSELAGCVDGVPQLDVGQRTDVLDGCSKWEGLRMLIRSMAPQVVAADEIGTAEDMLALQEAAQSGVQVISTAHGSGLESLARHPVLGEWIQKGYFSLIFALHWQNGQVVWRQEGGTSV